MVSAWQKCQYHTGSVEERGEIACSIIATTDTGWRGWEWGRGRRRGGVGGMDGGFGHEGLQQL